MSHGGVCRVRHLGWCVIAILCQRLCVLTCETLLRCRRRTQHTASTRTGVRQQHAVHLQALGVESFICSLIWHNEQLQACHSTEHWYLQSTVCHKRSNDAGCSSGQCLV